MVRNSAFWGGLGRFGKNGASTFVESKKQNIVLFFDDFTNYFIHHLKRKKMKFTLLKPVWLLLLPLLFWNGWCNNGNDENQRNVTIHVNPANSVLACDRALTQSKDVTVTIAIFEYDDATGLYSKRIHLRDLDRSNDWEGGFDYNVKLGFKSYIVTVQAIQECSFCCTTANQYFGCTAPPSAIKDGAPYFYGEASIPESGVYFQGYLGIQSIRCTGC